MGRGTQGREPFSTLNLSSGGKYVFSCVCVIGMCVRMGVCVCECNESVGLCKCLGLLKDGTSGAGDIYTFGDYVYELSLIHI